MGNFSNFYYQNFLKETPDIVANEYERNDYDFDLFIGDSKGVLLAPKGDNFDSHSDIIRFLIQGEYVSKKDYNIVGVPKDTFTILGNPQKIDVQYSGIILPKQPKNPKLWDSKDVPGTYISFWYKKAANQTLLNLLLSYAQEEYYSGPFFVETGSGGGNKNSSNTSIKKISD